MRNGFTLIELLMVVTIFVTLAVLAIPTFLSFQEESDLNDSNKEIVSILRTARSKTLASEGDNQWGVCFTALTTPHQYTLFKGVDFDSRIVSFDKVYRLPETIEIYEIDLGGNEVVFDRVTGTTDQAGKVSLRLKADTSKTRTIYIENFGQIGLVSPSVPSDTDRIKDSRHIHFDCDVPAFTEELILTFPTVTKEIVIAENMESGQIYWEGEVDVDGDIQRLKVHTHRFNNPDTQFSVHRDQRYNNKALSITLGGDGSGSLIDYTAEGQESRGMSTYLAIGEAGNPQRQ